MKKTVDEYLKEVDYSFKGYIPSQEAIEFINFIKLVGSEENKSPLLHYKIIDNIFSKHKRHAIMIFRGAGKTTLIGEYLTLYIAVFNRLPNFGEVNLMLYVTDSAEGGAKNLRKNIEYRYEQSEILKELIPYIKFTDNRLEFRNKRGKILIVKMYGAQQNIRGTKELGMRPQLAILDDLLSEEDANSPTVLRNIENNITKAIGKALHPTKSKMILIGTPYNQNDPLYKRVESGTWNASVYPVCEKFPCSKEEFRGAWEDRFPYQVVKDMYDEAISLGKPDAFYQEMMLQIKSDEDRLVLDDEIIFDVYKKEENHAFYITTDFATSEKNSSDYSVISVFAVAGSVLWLVDGIAKKQTMDKNLDDLFYFVKRYRPVKVGIEVSGQQGGFISWIQQEMTRRQVWFNLEPVRPTKSKLQRFQYILPVFKRKQFFINKLINDNYKDELMIELKNATKSGFRSRHDDIIDTISMMIELEPNINVGNSKELDEFTPVRYDDLAYGFYENIDDIFEKKFF